MPFRFCEHIGRNGMMDKIWPMVWKDGMAHGWLSMLYLSHGDRRCIPSHSDKLVGTDCVCRHHIGLGTPPCSSIISIASPYCPPLWSSSGSLQILIFPSGDYFRRMTTMTLKDSCPPQPQTSNMSSFCHPSSSARPASLSPAVPSHPSLCVAWSQPHLAIVLSPSLSYCKTRSTLSQNKWAMRISGVEMKGWGENMAMSLRGSVRWVYAVRTKILG